MTISTCGICCESFSPPQPLSSESAASSKRPTITTCCQKSFHVDCINSWIHRFADTIEATCFHCEALMPFFKAEALMNETALQIALDALQGFASDEQIEIITVSLVAQNLGLPPPIPTPQKAQITPLTLEEAIESRYPLIRVIGSRTSATGSQVNRPSIIPGAMNTPTTNPQSIIVYNPSNALLNRAEAIAQTIAPNILNNINNINLTYTHADLYTDIHQYSNNMNFTITNLNQTEAADAIHNHIDQIRNYLGNTQI